MSEEVRTRVLVVEDEALVALDLSMRLQRMGYTVVGRAATCAEALALAVEHRPDVVLMDIVLSSAEDGIEAARRIQARLHTAVIYLTAYGDDATLQRARSTNPYGYLLKPIRDEELRCTVEIAAHKRILDAGLSAHSSMLDLRLIERTNALDAVNAKLNEASLELQQALRAKDLFLTRMSHELRTPLAAIMGFSDTLLMGLHGALNPEQSRHVTTILRSSEHLTSLINDLLDLSKIGAGQLELLPEALTCEDALAHALELAAPLADGKNLQLTTRLAEPALTVYANKRALQQILLNLVGNAIKFTEEGGISITCRRGREEGRALILFEIRDTGPGLSPQDQRRLFRPYLQLAEVSDPGHKGTGLGLHLSLQLAEQMGGTIRVDGAAGAGSLFTLALPESTAQSASVSELAAASGG